MIDRNSGGGGLQQSRTTATGSPVVINSHSTTAGSAAFSNVGQTWIWEDFFTGSQDLHEGRADGASQM